MNGALLKYHMARKGVSVEDAAEALGITRVAFWRKCKGLSEFKQSEIKKLVELLEIEDPSDVFFSDEDS